MRDQSQRIISLTIVADQAVDWFQDQREYIVPRVRFVEKLKFVRKTFHESWLDRFLIDRQRSILVHFIF